MARGEARTNFSFWLRREVPTMPPIRLLTPQQQTFKMTMSALSLISSALPPTADVFEACARLPVLTLSGHWTWYGSTPANDPGCMKTIFGRSSAGKGQADASRLHQTLALGNSRSLWITAARVSRFVVGSWSRQQNREAGHIPPTIGHDRDDHRYFLEIARSRSLGEVRGWQKTANRSAAVRAMPRRPRR